LRGNSKEATIRQQTTLKTKVSEAYGLIELIQCLKIDAGESDETIDEWTSENNGRLREYEAAIEVVMGDTEYSVFDTSDTTNSGIGIDY
jgi:hypothetical protein